jgi:hypothetical protein
VPSFSANQVWQPASCGVNERRETSSRVYSSVLLGMPFCYGIFIEINN